MGLNEELANSLKRQNVEDVPGARFDVPFATTSLGSYYGRIEKAKAGVFKAADKFARSTLEGQQFVRTSVRSKI